MLEKFFKFVFKKKLKKEVKKNKIGIRRIKQVCKKGMNLLAKKIVEKTK